MGSEEYVLPSFPRGEVNGGLQTLSRERSGAVEEKVKITLQMPDGVYETYLRHADALVASGKTASVEDLIVAQIDRFSVVAPMDRVVVVDARAREGLEKILSGGFIVSGSDLLQRVRELADLRIGGIRIDFTTRQLEQIKNYATRNRITVEDATRAIVRGMEERFFDIAG